MKVPVSWLREHAPEAPGLAESARLLSVSGTMVEAVHRVGVAADAGLADHFRVGRVAGWQQHPDADRLRVCQIDVGDEEPRQIVCGAANFDEGDAVAVVLPGGTLPDGTRIRPAKLRGQESAGMLLSAHELGLSGDHSGIMLLDAALVPGTELGDVLAIGDDVLELELTSNRPDCQNVVGVARELAAASRTPFIDAAADDVAAMAGGDVGDHVSVVVEAPDLCPRYMARAFVDVQVGSSPAWMQARLAAAGMRAINNVVDVANYTMLLVGQPLHAFDADCVRGGRIVVRRATDGEQVTTLDGTERTLDPQMLAIADAEQVAVIAGVMGAADVEVGPGTTRVVLESAAFSGPSVQRTSRRLGVRSESSGRFEKGLDPYLPERALHIASRLLVELCGARMVPGTIDVGGDTLEAPPAIALPPGLPSRVLGIDVDPGEQDDILRRLGYVPAADPATLRVPAWRMYDTRRPIDLVEEVGRFLLDRIPARLPAPKHGGMLTRAQRVQRLVEDAAMGMGLHEIVTYSLHPVGTGERSGASAETVVRVGNPMTVDHVELRTSLLPGLLGAAAVNAAAGDGAPALFESGRVFARAGTDETDGAGLPVFARERRHLGFLLAGELPGAGWDAPGTTADFAAASGTALALAGHAGAAVWVRQMQEPPAVLHPGQAAELRIGDDIVGWVATVHPTVATDHGLADGVVAGELDVDMLARAAGDVPRYRAVSEFPPIVEDVAVVLPDGTAAGDVVATAVPAGGELLRSVDVFDRYTGPSVPDGHHSLALRLVFRADDRTLVDADVVASREAVVVELGRRFGAVLRA